VTDISNAPREQPRPWYAKWGNIAQIASALVAIGGFGLVYSQLKILETNSINLRQNATEAAARQVYMSYSEAALRHPQFASSKNSEIKTGTVEYEQYKLFVAHMLFAYDEVLKVYDHPEWRKSFDIDLATHRKYLCEESNGELFGQYYEPTRQRIAALRKDCADKLQKSATRK
jgi:hypothetical protein